MAIGTDANIDFFGTADQLDDTTTSAITDGSFSVAADISAWTNDDDAKLALFKIKWQYASGTIDTGARIHLYARRMNIDSTEDENTPSATYRHAHVCSFIVDTALGTSTDQEILAVGSLEHLNAETSQQYEFYLENATGVTIAANWDLRIYPKASGPHA